MTGLVGVPTVWQHVRAAGATHMLAAAVVVAATALDSVVVSRIDVIAAVVVVASAGSVDTVAAKVEESDSIVVTPISPVVSELLSTLEGRQGPAETAPRKMVNANAENRILADRVA